MPLRIISLPNDPSLTSEKKKLFNRVNQIEIKRHTYPENVFHTEDIKRD